jgi:hypothetical protein
VVHTAQRQVADKGIQTRECPRVAFETSLVLIFLQVLGSRHTKCALLPDAEKSHLAHLHYALGEILLGLQDARVTH